MATNKGKGKAADRTSKQQAGDAKQTGNQATEEQQAILAEQNSIGRDLTADVIQAAIGMADDQDRPIRIPPDHHLETGLAHYGMWVRMFTEATPPPSATGEPTGRIWA